MQSKIFILLYRIIEILDGEKLRRDFLKMPYSLAQKIKITLLNSI